MTNDHPRLPTADQIEQTRAVQKAVMQEIILQANEGAIPATILTGLSMAIVEFMTAHDKPSRIAPWFAQQAQLVQALQGDNSKAN